MESSMNYVWCYLGGAIAGAAIALLFAPESGKSLRRRICNKAKERVDHLKDGMEEAHRRCSKTANDVQ